MGYAERNNPKSVWNKKRMSNMEISNSTQTTQKQNFVQATTSPQKNEPVVIELSFKTFWENLCRRVRLLFRLQDHALKH